ncbi:LiaF domain-containing protein [Lactobacillus porci]|jgi:predicted membrane protein|uniref:LiaF domain-containing protein n=1 Tax=Lactobacillus porci TaxID=2012477 RepID=UPI002A2C7824|nr:LiaF-related protein [Lactobacillus porci]MDD6720069.1 LiaF-related protein [Lactobacillus porci]
MRKRSNITWGIIFLAAACLVILSQLVPGFSRIFVFSWGQVFWLVILAWVLYKSLKGRVAFLSVLAGGFIVMIFSDAFGWFHWTGYLTLGLILLAIGVQLLDKHGSRYESDDEFVFSATDSDGDKVDVEPVTSRTRSSLDKERVAIDLVMGRTRRRLHSRNLHKLSIDCVMGQLSVYLDDAQLKDNEAKVDLDCFCGEVTLYVPKEWHVSVDMPSFLASLETFGAEDAAPDAPVLKVDGDTVFSRVRIVRV